MRVVSGAGEFEISVERIEVRSGVMVLVGKMGYWSAETFVDAADMGRITRLLAHPRVLGWMASRPFAAMARALRGRARKGNDDA